MAIYTKPVLEPRLNRSRGGSCFTKNSSGFIIRARKKPLLKRTDRTSSSRSKFRNVVSNFRNLTTPEKTAWSTKSPQFPRVNSLGTPYDLNNNNLFQSLNQNRVFAGEAINPTAPDAAVFPVRTIAVITMDVNPLDLTISLDDNTIPANFDFEFWSSPFRQGLLEYSFPNDFRLLQTFSPGAYADFDLAASYEIAYGPAPTETGPGVIEYFCEIYIQATYLPSGEKAFIDSKIGNVAT